MSFKQANLKLADFRGARGLTPQQIMEAENWDLAIFDPEFLVKLKEMETAGFQSTAKSTQRLWSR